MNKLVSPDELVVVQTLPPMTKYEKLMHLARIIRTCNAHLALYSGLEHHSPAQQDRLGVQNTAFAVALADPILRDAGLKGDNLGDAKKFFELSAEDLHAFSCDCGGSLTNRQMADRIEHIAGRPASMATVVVESSAWTGLFRRR